MTRTRSVTVVAVCTLLLSACQWTMVGYGPERTGHNPGEKHLSTANVASLQEQWRASPGGCAATPPAVWHSRVYNAQCGAIAVYPVGGGANCSGDPAVCSPEWTTAPLQFCQPASCPPMWTAVGSGVVVVVASDGRLEGYDADGQSRCFGTPKVCEPLWKATIGGQPTAPAIANGKLFITADRPGGGSRVLSVFDVTANEGCAGSPWKVCEPLWTAQTPGLESAPAVAGGVVYVGGSARVGPPEELVDVGILSAFDANGVENCTGTPGACTPLWTGQVDCFASLSTFCRLTVPAVANGVVYVGAVSEDFDFMFRGGGLYAFDAAGSVNCQGSPATCAPLWEGGTDAVDGAPAVANGVVYVNSRSDFWGGEPPSTSGSLRAFDAAGVANCSGTPKTCSALWRVEGGSSEFPAVANGVVYHIDRTTSSPGLRASNAAESASCTGTPKTCPPLWTHPTTGAAGLVIANGRLFTAIGNTLRAFSIP